MNKKEYNGWYNYETWLVNLWMDNDGGSQEFYSDMAQIQIEAAQDKHDAGMDFPSEVLQDAQYDLAEALKESHEEMLECLNMQTGVFADLLGAAMSEVNWYEIAKHLVDDAKENMLAEA